jgi:aerobic-type carbon monoxide dehydrogenase small subunit (CoxS/CutS family)
MMREEQGAKASGAAAGRELKVNGRVQRAEFDDGAPLLGVLREDLGLTGTRYGCGEAQCGACTVLIDGKPARSCVTPAADAVGKDVTTVEGLEGQDGRLHPVQEAFLAEDAFQCGYCTSGMVLSAAALLKRTSRPTDDQILQAMHGNVCRCGAYPRIVAAVRRAAGVAKEGGKS